MKRLLLRWFGKLVNDDLYGDGFGVPNNGRTITVPQSVDLEYSFVIDNDAFEVVVGLSERDKSGHIHSMNLCILRREVLLKFARWYLWRWAWGEWFGLRRKLFYIWLSADMKAQGLR